MANIDLTGNSTLHTSYIYNSDDDLIITVFKDAEGNELGRVTIEESRYRAIMSALGTIAVEKYRMSQVRKPGHILIYDMHKETAEIIFE